MPEALPELRDPTPAEQPQRGTAQPQPQPLTEPVTEATQQAKSGLNKEERVERAKQAAAARWAKKVNWDTIPLDEGMAQLAVLRAELERAGLTLERRRSEATVVEVECYGCHKRITPGSAAGNRTRYNEETGIPETAYACSGGCFLIMTRDFTHRQPQREG